MANKFIDVMSAIAEEIAGEPSWQLYAEYCEARAAENREDAAAAAKRFAEVAGLWPFEERRRFTMRLMSDTGHLLELVGRSALQGRFSRFGRGLVAPRQVVESVVNPTLIEWRQQQPMNAEPHFWLGLYGEDPEVSLREAIRLNPAHGSARAALVLLFLNYLDHNQHELPLGYLGSPHDDLVALGEAEAILTEAVDGDTRAELEKQISAYRSTAKDWIGLRDQLLELNSDARRPIWQGRPGNYVGKIL